VERCPRSCRGRGPTRGAARGLERHEVSASASTSAGRERAQLVDSRHSRKRRGSSGCGGRWMPPSRGAARAARERAGRAAPRRKKPAGSRGRSAEEMSALDAAATSRRSGPSGDQLKERRLALVALEDATREAGSSRGGGARVTQTERRRGHAPGVGRPRADEHKLELERTRSWPPTRLVARVEANGASPRSAARRGARGAGDLEWLRQEDERCGRRSTQWGRQRPAVDEHGEEMKRLES